MIKTPGWITVIIALSGIGFAQAQTTTPQGVPQIPPPPAKGPMTFFITSSGLGKGADLGGLAGADAHCQKLAESVGAGNHTWRAYLSAAPQDGQPAIDARDRIGTGPWHNQAGYRIAADVAHLHGDTLELARNGNLINQVTALTEKGEMVPGEMNKPNQHDILTGTQADGTAYADALDHTCKNWTSSSPGGSAQLGHHDRQSRITSGSWNSAHPSRGCSQENLVATGGAGQFYCFAADTR
ncbi:MAG: lectin [Acidobacteria bacterium]|nr:lectin [Acidobacteriota bacterium]